MATPAYCIYCGGWKGETEDFVCSGCRKIEMVLKEISVDDRKQFLNLQARVVILEEKLGNLILDCPGCEKAKK